MSPERFNSSDLVEVPKNQSLHCLDPHRIVFYKKGVFQGSSHYICELAYNANHYFFSLQSVGNLSDKTLTNESCVLTLPICRQTVQLIESHCQQLDTLAARITLDHAGKIKILGFDLDKVVMRRGDLPQKPRLPILDRSMMQRS